jgi:hypothetical protein
MKKIFLMISSIFIFSVGCTDLDDELYDRIPADKYPENAKQVATLAVPTYQAMRDFLDWGGWWFCQEVPSDEMTCPTRDTDWDDGGKWRVLHQHTWTNNTEAINAMWGTFYNGIFEANKAIEFMGDVSENPAGQEVVAKLKIMRAYYYYLLIDNYGDVPYVTSFSDAPDEPEKEDRAIIFNNIVTDIEANLKYLSPGNTKTAVTKGMTFSLLAKLYINAEVYTGTPEWEKAEDYCDSVILSGSYSLDSKPLDPFVTNNEGSFENIFVIPYDEDNYEGFNLHMRTLHYVSNQTFNMSPGPWNGFAVMEDHYKTYSDNDLRKDYFLVGQQYDYNGVPLRDEGADGASLIFDPHIPALTIDASYTPVEIRMSGARVVKFEIKLKAKENLSNDFPIFRYADILLLKSEAMVRQGLNGDDYINEVRERAGIEDLSGATLDDILEERGREMFWEAHRRQDLIRFGKFNDAWWEKSASTPDRNTFPIPQWAIDANGKLAK